MSELLTRVRAQIRERMDQTRPAVREHERLEAALAVLGALPGSAFAAPSRAASAPSVTESASTPTAAGREPRKRRSPGSVRRARAPRGANRTAVLEAARGRPGASAGELAAATGVSRPVVYALVKTLIEEGELVKQELPAGLSGYALPAEPPAAGWVGGEPADASGSPSSGQGSRRSPAAGATAGE
jgi:IclR helix-turn-helix domain